MLILFLLNSSMAKTASLSGETDVATFLSFDHLEFTVGDAGSISRTFKFGLGLLLAPISLFKLSFTR